MSTLLRLCTAGSVDDGKSTLIGRLLYEARAVYEDQLSSVQAASRNRGAGPIDFSLFTDGLKAEREQGITIDVAYRYFATARRKFILADTPGPRAVHAQHGDRGLDGRRSHPAGRRRARACASRPAGTPALRASRHHALRPGGQQDGPGSTSIAAFDGICGRLRGRRRDARHSAERLNGDNVIDAAAETPWFTGGRCSSTRDGERSRKSTRSRSGFRCSCGAADHEFRGYAGQIASGTIRQGDRIMVSPSGRQTRISRIVTWDGDLAEAHAPMSVTLTLDDEVDVSRGDVISTTPLHATRRLSAHVVWMDERPLEPGRVYLLKHAARTVTAELDCRLTMNEIGLVTVTAARPLLFDAYHANRTTGSFIVIDPATNATAGAGMIVQALDEDGRDAAGSAAASALRAPPRGRRPRKPRRRGAPRCSRRS
jgi:sulfate adenylyltransferase subunit 1 (EFTu-like GTPase family)